LRQICCETRDYFAAQTSCHLIRMCVPGLRLECKQRSCSWRPSHILNIERSDLSLKGLPINRLRQHVKRMFVIQNRQKPRAKEVLLFDFQTALFRSHSLQAFGTILRKPCKLHQPYFIMSLTFCLRDFALTGFFRDDYDARCRLDSVVMFGPWMRT